MEADQRVINEGGVGAVRPRSEKRILPALILCWFFFWIGAHRFYVGKPGTAILHILTLGGLGVWAVVDTIMIVTGSFTDSEGNKITSWT